MVELVFSDTLFSMKTNAKQGAETSIVAMPSAVFYDKFCDLQHFDPPYY